MQPRKFVSLPVNMYKNPGTTANQPKVPGTDKVDPGAYRSGRDQAKEIISAMDSNGLPAGITYSANHVETELLKAYYNAPPGQKDTAWTNLTNQFKNAGGQGAVMRSFLEIVGQLQHHERDQYRILPVSTMAQSGGVGNATPQWLHDDMENIKNFAANGGTVIGWQNEDSVAANRFAVGGGVGGKLDDANATYKRADDDYVQGYLNALAAASAANQPVPDVPEHPNAGAAPAPVTGKIPETEAETKEKTRRTEEQAAYIALFEASNPLLVNAWQNVLQLAPNAKQDPNPTMLTGVDGTTPKYSSGYYNGKTPDNRDRATICFDASRMEVKMAPKANVPLTYLDYANGRDFLQSQGVSSITIDFGDKFNDFDIGRGKKSGLARLEGFCRDRVKYLLDSIYAPGWEGKVDANGFPLPGVDLDKVPGLKQPPLGITNGPNTHKFIAAHIGEFDPKTGIGTDAGKLAYQMLTLERQSQQRLLQHNEENQKKKNEAEPVSPAPEDLTSHLGGVSPPPSVAPAVPAAPLPPSHQATESYQAVLMPDPKVGEILPNINASGPAQLPDGKDPVFEAVKDVATALVDHTKTIDPEFDSSKHEAVLKNAEAPERTHARPVDITDFDANLEKMLEERPADRDMSFDQQDILELHSISKSLGEDDSVSHQDKEAIRDVLKEFVEKTLNDPFEKAGLRDEAIEKLKERKAPEATIEAFENRFKPQSLSPSPN